jgi:hypothetical protein
MNGGGRKKRNSCVDEEVCADSMRIKRKNLKKPLTRAGVVRDTALIRTYSQLPMRSECAVLGCGC